MPDESSTGPDRANSDRSEAHPPLPRDKRGWQVAPAPDGRGMPEHANPGPPPHRMRGFWYFVLALIALNWLSVLFFQPSTGEERVTVPFSPYFLTQVKAGTVEHDRLQGRHDPGQVQDQAALPGERQEGDADEGVRHPGAELLERRPAVGAAAGKGRADQRRIDDHERVAAGGDPARVRPDAADRRPVRADLQTRREKRRRHGRARQLRQIAGAPGGPGKDPRHVRRRRRDRRGQGRTLGDRRLPAQPRALRQPRRAHAPRRAAVRRARDGQDAARPRGRRRGARGVLLDLRLGVHRGDRRRRRRRACATCSRRPRRRRRRSSSSTSSTRSGARARARCR